MENMITWTEKKFKSFKKVYNKSVENKETQFVFEGNEFLRDYAKYLIQYLETQFK